MSMAIITDLQKGYAALRNLENSQNTSSISALTASNAVLQTEVKAFKEKLLGDTRELPNGERILAAEYELLCELADLNKVHKDGVLSSVMIVEGGRIVDLRLRWLKNISPLGGLGQLRRLDLCGNKISELGALLSLAKLESLVLSDNKLNTLGALSGLTRLKELFLNKNRISDLSGLSGMTSLEVLHLGHNQVSDLRSLSGLRAQRSLYIQNNQITDLSTLLALRGLEELWVTDNPLGQETKAVLDKLRAAGVKCFAPEGFR